MKKSIPVVAVAALASVMLTAVVLERESSICDNPLLSANVEALSAVENIDNNIIDLGQGTVVFLNMSNRMNAKNKPMNCCIAASGNACVVNSGHMADGKFDIFNYITRVMSKLNSELISLIKKTYHTLFF